MTIIPAKTIGTDIEIWVCEERQLMVILDQKEKSMKFLTTVLVGLVGLASSAAHAGDLNDVYLGKPGHAGSGCPSDTVSATLSPDKKSLSILFDDYLVEAGPSIGKKMARKNCQLAIPVHVPNGFSVSLMSVDYRGYLFLPRRAQSVFTAEYFFAGIRGPRLQKRFRGGMDDDYMISEKLVILADSWSKCGEDVNLRIATSMRLRNTDRREDAMATVDSIDMKSGILYKLQYRKCKQKVEEDDLDDDLWGDDFF